MMKIIFLDLPQFSRRVEVVARRVGRARARVHEVFASHSLDVGRAAEVDAGLRSLLRRLQKGAGDEGREAQRDLSENEMQASAASRRCVARSSASSLSPARPRRSTAPASRARSLAVRAFGPGSELQEGVEVGARVKVTKPIKVRRSKRGERERGSNR